MDVRKNNGGFGRCLACNRFQVARRRYHFFLFFLPLHKKKWKWDPLVRDVSMNLPLRPFRTFKVLLLSTVSQQQQSLNWCLKSEQLFSFFLPSKVEKSSPKLEESSSTSYRTHSQPMRRSNLMTCHKESGFTGKWHDLREWPVGHRKKKPQKKQTKEVNR